MHECFQALCLGDEPWDMLAFRDPYRGLGVPRCRNREFLDHVDQNPFSAAIGAAYVATSAHLRATHRSRPSTSRALSKPAPLVCPCARQRLRAPLRSMLCSCPKRRRRLSSRSQQDDGYHGNRGGIWRGAIAPPMGRCAGGRPFQNAVPASMSSRRHTRSST